MPDNEISDLEDRVTRIEFAFAQFKWAVKEATPAEREELPSCDLSDEEVEKLLCLLARFASVIRSFASIDCPGPRCRSTEEMYQVYKSNTGGGGEQQAP